MMGCEPVNDLPPCGATPDRAGSSFSRLPSERLQPPPGPANHDQFTTNRIRSVRSLRDFGAAPLSCPRHDETAPCAFDRMV